MLEGQKVFAGKYYVNRNINVAREVLEVNARIVRFISYHLDTGNSTGIPNECMKEHFTRWAEREATSGEISVVQQRKEQNL